MDPVIKLDIQIRLQTALHSIDMAMLELDKLIDADRNVVLALAQASTLVAQSMVTLEKITNGNQDRTGA